MKKLHSYKSGARLAVVGAGPKALAIGLRAHVLKELGLSAPEILIIEKNEVAAHWTGRHGFTNGRLSLGTSPEKDLGFPYENDGSELSLRIADRLQNYSWRSFLIRKGSFSTWVDRGNPAPTHAEWGEYLQFVAQQIKGSVDFLKSEVIRVVPRTEGWEIMIREGSHLGTVEADGLVLTGPASPRTPACRASEKILNMENFWSALDRIPRNQSLRVAVVGNGETAASILIALSKNNFPHLKLDLISPHGAVFTRGESFLENQFYSTSRQTSWQQLRREDRRNFVQRTDLGVFSPGALAELQRETINIIPGRVECARDLAGEVQLDYEYDGKTRSLGYDLVVFASGLNHMRLLEKLLRPEGLAALASDLKIDPTELTRESFEERIDSDLSVIGLRSKLYLPMLAGLEQGPGFANLSCLGMLASRILDPLTSLTKEEFHETRYRLHSA